VVKLYELPVSTWELDNIIIARQYWDIATKKLNIEILKLRTFLCPEGNIVRIRIEADRRIS